MPQISIISTVFNGEQYLEEYFFGIENQTFTDYELILINDGSTDNSGYICEEHAKKDARIHVYQQNNQGLAAARNNALRYTSTEWITFIDCDDSVHPQYLEILNQGIQDYFVLISGVGIVETETIPLQKHDYINPHWEKYYVNEAFLIGNICSAYFGQIACGKLINKQLLLEHPFTVGRVFEDNAVVKKWIYDAKTVVVNDCPLYYYRVNYSGLSKGILTAKKVNDVLWSRDEIINFYKEKGLEKAYEQAERNYILFAINLFFKLRKVDKENAAKLKLKTLERYNSDKSVIPFSEEDNRFVFELKHPVLMWFYWKIKGIM